MTRIMLTLTHRAPGENQTMRELDTFTESDAGFKVTQNTFDKMRRRLSVALE